MKLLSKFSILILITNLSYALDVDKHLELSYVQTSGNTNTTTFSSKLQSSTALNEKFADLDQVIEAALAHKKRGVKADYDKATHLEDRIYIMQWWADHVTNMANRGKLVA